MRAIKNGFTLIEVLIAVLVLSVALGASLQAIGNYTESQAILKERYYAHLIAWDVLIQCYTSLQIEPDYKCKEFGVTNLKNQYWDWEGVKQEGFFREFLTENNLIEVPLEVWKIKVYSPADNRVQVAGELATILPKQ